MNRLLHKANQRLSLGNAATILIIVALLGQLLGFFRSRLISTNFTVTDPAGTDAFFAAFQIPDFFFFTISAGALGVAFLPVLTDRLAGGDRKGMWELSSSLLNLLGIIMAGVAALILVFARPLLHYVVAPALDPHQLDQATTIMRIIALNPMLFTLSGILMTMQQTFGRFFFYAIAPLCYNLAIIASVYLFKHNLGVVGLGVGACIGAVLQLLVACLGLFGLDFKYRPKINLRTRDFRLVLRQLPARSLDQGIDSVNSIVEINRATKLGHGPASYYTYAQTLMNVPIFLFGNSIAAATFPRLTERLAQKRPDLFHSDFFRFLRVMIWIAMPVVVVSFFGRGYLARLLYGDVAPQVALIFGYLTMAIFFRIIYTLISRYFYAQKDTKTPLFASLFAIGLNIFLAFSLASKHAYGIAGLAMAQSITAAVEVSLLILVMLWRDPYVFNRAFWSAALRILSVTGFSAIAGYITVSFLPLNINDHGIVTIGLKFGLIAGVTLLVHLAISALFGLQEAQVVLQKLKRMIMRPVRIQ